jgi:hypothetical protein
MIKYLKKDYFLTFYHSVPHFESNIKSKSKSISFFIKIKENPLF